MKKGRTNLIIKSLLMKVLISILIFAVIISVIIILQYNPTRSEINNSDTASPPGWYQQNLPNMNGKPISDITFTDSLTGYAVTPYANWTDTNYIIKTTNGGDNWFFVLRQPGSSGGFNRVIFLNNNTGFAGGNFLIKTTNGGNNWFSVSLPFGKTIDDMFVLSNDTIWFTDIEPLTGGIFRTTNGGASWQKMDNGITGNLPTKLYFYNSNIGFASYSPQSNLFKTTNGGVNWFLISPNDGLIDLYFFDSLTGYKSNGNIRKTTNGGYNWVTLYWFSEKWTTKLI